jgi:hypothetical protein
MAITMEPGEFDGHACRWLSNGLVELAVTTARGPRVLFWGWAGRSPAKNLMATVPGFVARGFTFLGGHRLWAAPESFARTYQADDAPPTLDELPDGLRLTAPADGAGLVKEMTLTLSPGAPQVSIMHMVRNTGSAPLDVAPWALSMLRLGGIMLLPQLAGPADADGLLPNRRLVLWPYSRVTDPRLRLGDRLVHVDARPGPPNKIGTLNQDGWLAYWLDGTLFSTRFDPRPEAAYPDLGCNAECFFDDRFIELETLGPLVRLEPGDETRHVEVWQLQRTARPDTEAGAEAVAGRAGLRAGQGDHGAA